MPEVSIIKLCCLNGQNVEYARTMVISRLFLGVERGGDNEKGCCIWGEYGLSDKCV